MAEEPWYQEARERYRPDHVRLLLIGESAPTDHDGKNPRNFFYADHLGYDNLYRGVVEALYGVTAAKKGSHDKERWLRRLQADGVFLIDAVPFPVNDKRSRSQRLRDIQEHSSECVERAASLSPDGIVVCGGRLTCVSLMPRLKQAGLPLLHDGAIPFPLGNVRRKFVDQVRIAVGPLGLVDLTAAGKAPAA